jgi:hypothetical protein
MLSGAFIINIKISTNRLTLYFSEDWDSSYYQREWSWGEFIAPMWFLDLPLAPPHFAPSSRGAASGARQGQWITPSRRCAQRSWHRRPEKDGGAILDSGTSLTILATPTYEVLVAVLSARFIGVPQVSMDPLEYYYNWTATAGGEVHRRAGGRVAWVSVISNIL